MKINVSCDWGGTITNYELRREIPLYEHIDTICKEFKAPEPSENYALFVDSSYTYIKAEVSRPLLSNYRTSESVHCTPFSHPFKDWPLIGSLLFLLCVVRILAM